MAENRWDRLDRLFDAACLLPPDRRAAYVVRECGGDTALRGELTSLLRYASDDALTPSSVAAFLSGAPSRVGRLTPETDARIGQSLRHYTIEVRIGGGGMGVVYRAHDTRLDRPVALKFLLPALLTHPSAKRRFLAEARAGAAIDHPNICTVFEVDEAEDGMPFIAMAYYEGETLREKLARERLSIADALDYVVQAAEGLRAAHARGIVHRDVKPGNIFITTRRVAKLLDFGVAKVANLALTTRHMALGTVGYMSPEQLEEKPVDARSDIWSLGVVLFETIAFQRPFPGENAARVIRAVLHDEPASLCALRPEAPPAVATVTQRALAKDAADRYQTVEELLLDLRSASAAEHRAHG